MSASLRELPSYTVIDCNALGSDTEAPFWSIIQETRQHVERLMSAINAQSSTRMVCYYCRRSKEEGKEEADVIMNNPFTPSTDPHIPSDIDHHCNS